tara:strand:+ start:467 stop:679 length:213 start_codon:yes stop_codon:yes gene_type:complete
LSLKKQGIILLAVAAMLIALGIIIKRQYNCIPGLYVCHIIGGSFLLLGLVNLVIVSEPAASESSTESSGE